MRAASASDPQWRNTVTGALAAARAGRTVVVAVTFTKTSANKAIRDTSKWRDGESAMTHLFLTLTPKSLPVGDAKGWPELRTTAESDARRFSCHKRGGVYVQPANLDADKIVRHEDIASWAGDTKFVLFTRDAPVVARAVLRDQLHRPTTIMRGTLAYSRNRATELMGTWWSGDTPIPISFVELPDTLDVQSVRCLRMCMWEPSDNASPIDPDPTEEGKRSRVGRHRFWLRELSDSGSQHRFPACMVPNALVQYFHTALGVPTSEIQLAVVRAVQAGLR